MAGKTLTLVHLYPVEMNIYGDRGNVMTLRKRLEWRGIDVNVVRVGVGDEYDLTCADIIFAGGGQDRGQVAVGEDLMRHADALHRAADSGVAMLTICGTYQLFGRGFTTLEGQEIPGIGLLKSETTGSDKRMIGNIVVTSEFGQLVGFENHSGETILDADQEPLGRVVKGFGNNYTSGYEGARRGNVLGTYLHGPILPKNPRLADALLLWAVQRKFGQAELPKLDDKLEYRAAEVASAREQ